MTSHDTIFKQFLNDPEVAKDFLEAHLPLHIKQYCDLNSLKAEPTSLIEPKLKQHFADMIYSLHIADQVGYIYVLIEHQSSPDKLMPFRMLRYQVSIMQQHIHKTQSQKLPIVIPLVFYTGKTTYTYSTQLSDCFEQPELAQHFIFKDLILIDITKIGDDEILQHKKAALLEIVQKHIFKRDTLNLARMIIRAIQHFEISHDLFKNMLEYVITYQDDDNYQDFLNLLTEEAKQYQGDIMNIAERIRLDAMQQGIQQGMQQGMQQGALKEKLEVAKLMLNKKMDLILIEEITGLSQQELQQLKTCKDQAIS